VNGCVELSRALGFFLYVNDRPYGRRLTRQPLGVRRVSLVYRREARVSPELRSVIGFIVSVMRQHASRLRGQIG